MGSKEEFWKNSLVIWIQTFRREQPLKSMGDFADGVFLSQVMLEIDPTIFGPLRALAEVDIKDLNVQVQNLAEVMRNVKRFYQEVLHQLLVMKMPDLLAIVKDPESDYSLQELKKILLLILGCAIQCERKEYFIEKIKDLDVDVQRGLVTNIQEITENSENVLSYRLSDVAELPHDQLYELSESMFYQIQKLVEERDEYIEATLDLHLEKHETGPSDPRGTNGRTPPLSPSGSLKSSILQANKQRLRDLQNELEERNLSMGELREEIASLKEKLENMIQENKVLQTEARWAKTYRDEIDELKSQLDRMNKVEGENAKYKDKVRELDFYKTRLEELNEQHQLLYETKMVLEEQLKSSGVKIDRVGHLDDENEKLLAQIKLLTSERENDQSRIQELLDETVKLNTEKQSSHNEIAVLSAELESYRSQDNQGISVPLAVEYNATTSTELLRLDKENKRLMKLVDTLRDNNPRSRELERENIALTSSMNEKKRTISKLTQELTNERTKVYRIAEMANLKADELSNLELKLNSNLTDKSNLLNDIARKNSDMEALQQAMYESQQRFYDNGVIDKKTQERLLILENDIIEKKTEVQTLQAQLKNEQIKGDQLVTEVSKRKEMVTELEAKVKECETYNAKVDQQLARREKDISSLERRFESAMTENKSLSQSVNLKDDKISALEERITHLLDSASQDTRKVNKTLEQKLKQIRDLETRLEEVQEQLSEQVKLKASLKQREEKIDLLSGTREELEGKLHDLELEHEKAKSSCLKLEHSLKLKDERISSLEASLSEIGSSSTLQQNDRIAYLSKSLSMREQELRDLEGRNDEILALNAKIKNSNRQKDDKIQALEDRVSELEGTVKPSNDEKVQQLMQKLRKKEDELVLLEEKLEDSVAQSNKLQRATDIKEEKIQQLEKSFHDLEDSAGQAQKFSTLLEEKTKRLYDVEARVEELLAENKKLAMKAKQKEDRYNSLEQTLHELENAASDKSSLSKMLQTKESKIQSLQKTLDEKEESIVEKDTLLDEFQGRCKKLMHALKLREEKLHSLESKIEQLEELESVSTKLGNLLRQREDRIKELEEKTDGLNDVTRQNERLKELTKQKDDKILGLEERLEDLEDAVKINERLNQQVHQKEEKISALKLRNRGLEDALHKAEQLKDSITKNAEDQIQELNRKVDELMDVKVKRQQSIRRREEKIMSLESRLEEVASEKEHKMNKIQELQSRLEGTMTKFRKLDLSNEEKDEKIQELEARVSELRATYKEHRKLVQQSKLKEEMVIRLEARLEEAENTNKRLTANASEYESSITSLKQRLEETLGLNSRLDQSVKKQEEKVKQLENQVQDQETKVEVGSKEKQSAEKTLQKNRQRLEDLENALLAREKDLSDMEKRLSDLKASEENEKNKSADLLRQRDSRILELEARIKSLEVKSKTELVLVRNRREPENKVNGLERKIDELSNENRRTKLVIQEKDGVISDLEKRMDELQVNASDSDKLNKIVKEKNSQIGILRGNVEQYQKEIVELETRCDSFRSEASRSQASLRQKDDRIMTLKSQLEENLAKVHRLSNDISARNEKIKSLERSFAESSNREMELKEEMNQMEAQLDALRQKLGTHVTEKIQFTKRARTELYISRASTVNQHVLTVADLRGRGSNDDSEQLGVSKEEYDLLEKERTRLREQNEYLSSLNASLQTQIESLRSELESLKNDYSVVLDERDEAREQYKDIDMSAAKIAHRCEVLVKLNDTLEEECKVSMDQINKLLEQNQNLLFKSLESRDQFLEEERAFSDRLYFLEREKERLCDQVDAANKALEGTPKKKNLLWRGANKVLKKAGLKKKKDEKQNVSLIRVTRSPEGESRSENSDSSFSPNQTGWRRDPSRDETNMRSLSPEFAPIRTALSRSRLDLQNVGTEPNAYNSPSSGSEQSGPSSRLRPKSEFYAPSDFESPIRRPKSMEMLDALRVENESFLTESETRAKMHPGRYGIESHPRLPDILRKDSVNSNSSNRSNVSVHSSTSRQSAASSGLQSATSSGPSQGGRMFSSVVNTRDFTDLDTQATHQEHSIQKVRITEMVIPKSSHTHVPDDISTPVSNVDRTSNNHNPRSDSMQDSEVISPQLSYIEPTNYARPSPHGAETTSSPEDRNYTLSVNSSPFERNRGSFSEQQRTIETPKSSKASIFYVPLEEARLASSTPARSEQERSRTRLEDGSRSTFLGDRQLQRDIPVQRSVRVSVGQFEDRAVRQPVTPQDNRRRTVGSFDMNPQDLSVSGFSREGRSSYRGSIAPPPPPPPQVEPEYEERPVQPDRQESTPEKKPELWYEYGCV